MTPRASRVTLDPLDRAHVLTDSLPDKRPGSPSPSGRARGEIVEPARPVLRGAEGPDPAIAVRLEQVESLHHRGWSHRRIAADLAVSERTVRRDLRRLEALWLDRLAQRVAHERAHSIGVYREVQSLMWKVIDRMSDADDHKSIAAAARTIVAAEKEVDAILHTFEAAARDGKSSVRDLFAEFTDAELDGTDDPFAALAQGDENSPSHAALDFDDDPDSEEPVLSEARTELSRRVEGPETPADPDAFSDPDPVRTPDRSPPQA